MCVIKNVIVSLLKSNVFSRYTLVHESSLNATMSVEITNIRNDIITKITQSTNENWCTIKFQMTTDKSKEYRICCRNAIEYSDVMANLISHQAQNETIVVNCSPHAEIENLDLIIEYLYGSQIEFNNENIIALLGISVHLNIKPLHMLCIHKLTTGIHWNYDSVNIYNDLFKWNLNKEVIQILTNMISPCQTQFRALIDSQLPYIFDESMIKEFFKKSKFIAETNAEDVWLFLMKIIDCDTNAFTVNNLISKEIQTYINWCSMSPKFFDKHIDCLDILSVNQKYQIWKRMCIKLAKQNHNQVYSKDNKRKSPFAK